MNITRAFRRDGIAVLPGQFDVEPFVAHLKQCPVYGNHVRQGKPSSPLGSSAVMCHDMHDVIRAPGFFEVALRLTPMVEECIGGPPFLYSFNVFYTEPSSVSKPDIHEFHRDPDDTRFVCLFMYCVDILKIEDGPHQFIRGSHCNVDHGTKSVFGKRGTMFLTASNGLHRGLMPKHGRRMLAWIRWGVHNPPDAYVWDKLTPLPKVELGERYPIDPTLQQAIHLVAE
jgi:hypothetical protein